MDNERGIVDLFPGMECFPLEIRSIRTWLPHFRTDECCFLFVDKQGNGIEAVGPRDDIDELVRKFKLFGCYRINDYSCIEVSRILPAIDNKYALSVGPVTSAEPLPDDGSIPREYFRFCPYGSLYTRVKRYNNQARDGFFPLTDYIGRLEEKPTDGVTTTNRPFVRLTLSDASGEKVHVTLWEEVIVGTDRQAMDRTALDDDSNPVIVAVTSLQVDRFGNFFQLGSTSATYVYVNPSQPIVAELQELNAAPIVAAPVRQPRNQVGGHKESIAALLATPRDDAQDTIFTVNAKIERFLPGSKWCFTKCPVCLDDIPKNGSRYLCTKHRYFDEAHHGFCVGASLTDGRSTTTVTLFDTAMRAVCGLSCGDILYRKKWDSRVALPPEVDASVGIVKLFYVQLQGGRFTNTSYSCNRVGEPTVPESFFRSIHPQTPSLPRQLGLRGPVNDQKNSKRPSPACEGESSTGPGVSEKPTKRQLFVVEGEDSQVNETDPSSPEGVSCASLSDDDSQQN